MVTATGGKPGVNGVPGERVVFDAPAASTEVADRYRRLFDAASQSIRFRVVLVTPEMASRWLERNDKNRPLGNAVAYRYARSIRNGAWMPNGECIIFCTGGTLLDGQHRLRAVVLAGVAVPMCVIEGVDPAAYKTLNVGAKRTVAQYFAMDGERNAPQLAGALSYLGMILAGGNTGGRQMSVFDFYAMLEQHSSIRESVAYVKPKAIRKLIEPSPFAAVHYAITQKYPGSPATEFFESLLDGTNIESGSPVQRLRDQLIAPGPRKLDGRHKIAVTIKAFNHTLAGKPVRFIRFLPDEAFPEVA